MASTFIQPRCKAELGVRFQCLLNAGHEGQHRSNDCQPVFWDDEAAQVDGSAQ